MTTNKFLIKLEDSNYNGQIQISTAGAEQVADKLYNDVLEGRTSAANMVEMFNFVDKVASLVKERADVNGKYKFVDLVRDEIAANSDDGKSYKTKYGTKLELAETGVKYDYTACEDPEWIELNKKFEEIKKQKSEKEKFLQKISDKGLTVVNEETGEISKIHAPIKTSTSSYKQTLLKD